MSYDSSPIGDEGMTPSDTILQLENEYQQMNNADKQTDDLEDRYVKLGDTHVALEHFVASGKGIDSQSYGLLRLNINHLVNPITKGQGLLALESYGKRDAHELAVALENVVSQTLKDIWTAIKTAFINTRNKIKTWYIKAWDGSARLQKQAEAIKARAETVSGVAKESSFDFAGARYLSVDYRPASPEAIVGGIKTIHAISTAFLGKNTEDYTKLTERLNDVVKKTVENAKTMKDSDNTPAPAGQTDVQKNAQAQAQAAGSEAYNSTADNALLSEVLKQHLECLKALGITDNLANPNDARFKEQGVTYKQRKDTLLGNIILVGTEPPPVTDVNSYNAFKGGISIGVESKDAKPREVEDTAQFKTLSPPQITAICDDVIEVCKTFLNYKLLFDKRDQAIDKIIKELDSAASQAGSLKGVGERHVRSSIQTTSTIVRKINNAETRWSKYAMQVSTRAINLCKASLTKY